MNGNRWVMNGMVNKWRLIKQVGYRGQVKTGGLQTEWSVKTGEFRVHASYEKKWVQKTRLQMVMA